MEHVEQCEHCGLLPVTRQRRPTRIVAESEAMRALLVRAARFAESDAPVVLLGESGTGKEVVARALHDNGPRKQAPFVAVNVAALPAELLESELFGHAKGAFTGAARSKPGLFEEADHGTLFLDEIGEMPAALQAKLLRALQEGEIRRVGETRPVPVDVRVVCATHRDLGDLVRRGLFREDLYYRLKVLTLRIPPLRERRADILPLARMLLAAEGSGLSLEAAAERTLAAYDWPGNVRELINVMKHGAALATDGRIDVEHLPEELHEQAPRAHCTDAAAPASAALRPLADVERDHVRAVLEACGGSQSEAARILGIARNTLWRKLQRYG